MKLTSHIFLDLLGVGELIENISTVLKDRLGLNRRISGAELVGKTAIITGGNAGVGLATAEALVQRGAHVVLACRSAERGEAAAAQLIASSSSRSGEDRSTGGDGTGASLLGSQSPQRPSPRVEVELVDLASLASVRQFVARWAASGRQLDLIICNAGIMCPPERLETPDGFELQFQSNYLSHFLLANALVRHQQRQRQRKVHKQGQKGSTSQPLRVLFLTSMTHFGADLASEAKLADVPYCRKQWHSFQAYCNSKMCALLAAKHVDRLFARDAQHAAINDSSATSGAAAERDAAVAVHPGLVDTYLARNYFKQTVPSVLRPLTDPFFEHLFCPYLLRSPEAAAQTVLYAATAPASKVGGHYCGTAPHVSRHSAAANDPALAQRVWDLSAHLCKLGPEEQLA